MTKLTNFLEHKEKNFLKAQSMVSDNQSLIMIKVNYPSMSKLNGFTMFVFYECVNALKLVDIEITYSQHGIVGIMTSEEDPIVLKQRFVAFENTHALGRLIDIDVLTKHKMIGRNDINEPLRRCYLCENIAHVCIVNQTHTTLEVQQAFIDRVIDYCKFDKEKTAALAMYCECATTPSFGRVTPYTNGIHKDMDISTFIVSIQSIAPYFNKLSDIDPSLSDKQYFIALRNLGMCMEKAMLKATNNINTHKGFIFLALMLFGAYHKYPNQALQTSINQLALFLKEDFSLQPTTAGLKWSKKADIKSIRHHALEGFSEIIKTQNTLHKNMKVYEDINDAFASTLLTCMSFVDDTTILKRAGLSTLRSLKQKASIISQDKEKWEAFSKECIALNISPGGSADVLALLVILRVFFYDKDEETIWK